MRVGKPVCPRGRTFDLKVEKWKIAWEINGPRRDESARHLMVLCFDKSFVFLQPIMSRLEFYYDNRDEFRQKRKADQASWTRISDALRHVLRAATRIARERGVLSAEREHAYHISGPCAVPRPDY